MESRKGTINVNDEFEFKMWVKMIASIHKNGGDIKKPTDLLWKSVEKEVRKERCEEEAIYA